MSFEAQIERAKIEKGIEQKKVKEIEIKEEKIPQEKIVMGIRNLLNKKEIPRRKLPTWLKHLTKIEEKPIKITKDEYENNVRLYFQDIGIRIRVIGLEPAKVEIKIRERGEDITKIYLNGEVDEEDKKLAEKIIKTEGFLGIIKKDERWIVLKEGTEKYGFKHIVKKHFKEFEEEFGIKTEEELQKMILDSIKEAQLVEYDKKGGKVYWWQTEKGVYIRTIVNPRYNSIITSKIYVKEK